MSTRLKKIHAFEAEPMDVARAGEIIRKVDDLLESRKSEVAIEVVRQYNGELSRILYASPALRRGL